jgi:segregation and condensation protein B
MENTRIKSVIHSVLFASEKPVSTQKFVDIFDKEFDLETITASLEELSAQMENDETCGTKIENVANGWQIRTKSENNIWVKKLENVRPIRISVSALETLAIVAYKQPVHKAEVDKIRGVDSSHLVRTLLEKNLIKITGRSELPGKPLLYSTTPDFLEVFGLANLNELPSLTEIQDLATNNSFGDSGDYKEGINQSLRLIVEEGSNIELTEDINLEEMDQTLSKMTELGRELRVDIDLVQEKVDVVFEDACRKYANQRQEILNGSQEL